MKRKSIVINRKDIDFVIRSIEKYHKNSDKIYYWLNARNRLRELSATDFEWLHIIENAINLGATYRQIYAVLSALGIVIEEDIL